jgi:hypothetical protein
MKESESDLESRVLKIEDSEWKSESEVLCTDSTALVTKLGCQRTWRMGSRIQNLQTVRVSDAATVKTSWNLYKVLKSHSCEDSCCDLMIWQRVVYHLDENALFIQERADNTFLRDVLTQTIGRAMAQAVSRRPPTAEARVRSRLCGICGGQSGTGTGFSPSS